MSSDAAATPPPPAPFDPADPRCPTCGEKMIQRLYVDALTYVDFGDRTWACLRHPQAKLVQLLPPRCTCRR